MRLAAAAAIAAALGVAAAGCVAADPSICELRARDVVVFPADGAAAVPVNALVRVLAGDGDELTVALVRADDGAPVSGRTTLTRTGFGDVLELVPDYSLDPDERYHVEVADRAGVVTHGVFRTGLTRDDGPPTEYGAVVLEPISAEDRFCCASSGCREGTRIITPAPPEEAFRPQLVLLELDELSNDACGPVARPAGTVPVVLETSRARELVAETDLRLAGCYEVTVIDQANRVGQPDGPQCTPGFTWRPTATRPDCRTGGGCDCRTGAGDPDGTGALVALGVAWWAWTRRRRPLSM